MTISKHRKIHYLKASKPYLIRNGNLNSFYSDIRKYKPLEKEETLRLFDIYKNGSEEERKKAFDKLFNHNIRLVISFTRDYCGKEDNLNDLIQEGCIGLMKAIDKFDAENGTPFSVYALYWIKRYVGLFKIDYTPVIQQTNRSRIAAPLTRIINEMTQKLERVPTSEEILDEYNERFPQKPVNNPNDVINVEYIYIDECNNPSESNYERYNTISATYNTCDSHFEQEDRKRVVGNLMEGLTKGETQAIRMMYGIDGKMERSLQMIAHEMKISPQRASQLCNSAIKKMKAKSKEYAYALSD